MLKKKQDKKILAFAGWVICAGIQNLDSCFGQRWLQQSCIDGLLYVVEWLCFSRVETIFVLDWAAISGKSAPLSISKEVAMSLLRFLVW